MVRSTRTRSSDVHFPEEASFPHKVHHERAAQKSRALRQGIFFLPSTPAHVNSNRSTESALNMGLHEVSALTNIYPIRDF